MQTMNDYYHFSYGIYQAYAVKRIPMQTSGGVGSKGTETRDEDFVEHIYPATMHNTMMFFTQKVSATG